MAAFNPKRLTNPDIIRSIEPSRLLEFLTPYQSYLHHRGLPLPSAGQAQTLGLDQLVDVLLTPSEHTPQDLLNAVYLIDELSTPQGMDALLAAARPGGNRYAIAIRRTFRSWKKALIAAELREHDG